MALSKHINPVRHYSGIRIVRIAGCFETNNTTAPTAAMHRGNGFTVTYTATGKFNIVLTEGIRRLIGFGAQVMVAGTDGTTPFVIEFVSYTEATKTFVLQLSKNTAGTYAATTLANDATNHNNRISFWIESEESSATVR